MGFLTTFLQTPLYAGVVNAKIENDRFFYADKSEKDVLWPGLFKSDDNPEVTMKIDREAGGAGVGGDNNGFGGNFRNPKELTAGLEACDENLGSAGSALVIFDLESGKIAKSANTATNGFLFRKNSSEVCLKYDVDGVIWKLDDEELTMSHEATLNAMSYVIAGKPNLQFKQVSPENKVVCLFDRRMRGYLYNQSVQTETENVLRNRKSSLVVTSISTQRLLTLPQEMANENVVGLQMSEERIFVLLNKGLVIFRYRVVFLKCRILG